MAHRLRSTTQTISLIVGLLLFVLGVAGFFLPSLAGLHLSEFHTTVMAIVGGILFYNGYRDNDRDSFIACLCFGLFFGLHALAGFAFGMKENSAIETADSQLLRIIPNFYELGIVDHILNTVIGIILLGGAMDWWRVHHERKRWNRHDRRRDKFNRLAHH